MIEKNGIGTENMNDKKTIANNAHKKLLKSNKYDI